MPVNYYGNAPGTAQANQFNQQQYAATLAGYNQTYTSAAQRGQGVLAQYGQMGQLAQHAADYQKYNLGQQNYVAQQQSLQGAAGRGLTNSSYYDSLQQQANQNSYQQQMQLGEQLTNQQLGIAGQKAQYQDSLNQQLTGIQGAQVGYMGGYGSQIQNAGPQEQNPWAFMPSNQPQQQQMSYGGGGGGGGASGVGGTQWGAAWMPPSGLTGGYYLGGGGYGAQPYGGYGGGSGGGMASSYGVGGGGGE